ncbi:MAG: polysaccharide ABC transporter ATP-binding protein [Candidatus Electrothrix scaldis]|nr:MAG: polysaccharide ABC transporter ATP-binding protein [Candidatus Electrothrix sp. GW3-3]
MSSVIQIEDLWKEYRLGVIGHGTLREDMQSWWAKLCGKEDPNSQIVPMVAGQEKQVEGGQFWALRNINLELKKGEILGIIGRNGAGKSTLLKILSRVTVPTKGIIKIKGRIASLLEVGTGFHPELTGRENIFLNGCILGMSKLEIINKLDEIIEFSGVENFVDTPVKRYSSGMRVRLAFAVAAHLDPEILIIDEVLAVGDAQFQRKCLGKMKDVAGSGRTVLFVSHNLNSINSICNRCIYLNNGHVKASGEVNDIVSLYLKESLGPNELPCRSWDKNDRPGDKCVELQQVRFVNRFKSPIEYAKVTERIGVEFTYTIMSENQRILPIFHLYTSDGVKVLGSIPDESLLIRENFKLGCRTSVVWLPENFLNKNMYTVTAGLVTWLPFKIHCMLESVISLNVLDDVNSVTRPQSGNSLLGVIRPRLDWQF